MLHFWIISCIIRVKFDLSDLTWAVVLALTSIALVFQGLLIVDQGTN